MVKSKIPCEKRGFWEEIIKKEKLIDSFPLKSTFEESSNQMASRLIQIGTVKIVVNDELHFLEKLSKISKGKNKKIIEKQWQRVYNDYHSFIEKEEELCKDYIIPKTGENY